MCACVQWYTHQTPPSISVQMLFCLLSMLLSDVVRYVHPTETHSVVLFVCIPVKHIHTHTYLSFCLTHLSVYCLHWVLIKCKSLCVCFECSITDLCVLLGVSRCAPGFLGEYCHHKDPCHPGFCQNGGNCSVSMLAGVPVPGSASCTCPLGYTGQHCQTPQNSTCYPNNPCANNGVCTLLSLDKFKCECTRGWTGEILFNHLVGVRLKGNDSCLCLSPEH